jgi:hypothetical protein
MQNDLPPAALAPELTDLDGLCFICEREPATVDAILDDKPVSVCAACFAYETGEDEDPA